MRRTRRARGAVLILLAALAACDLANQFLPFEQSLTASKGESGDSIHLSWSNNFGEDEEEPLLYTVYRVSPDTLTATTSFTDYTDNSVDPGVMYGYYVRADNGRETTTEYGYSMRAAELRIYSSPWSHPDSETTSTATDFENIAWFHFYAQKGWSYDFLVNSDTEILYMDLYSDEDIEMPLVVTASIPSGAYEGITGWRCRSSGEYYVKVTSNVINTQFDYCAVYRN